MRRIAVLGLFALATLGSSERINHAGRILGALQLPTVATLFNTPQADAILSTMQIFPRDSAWNEVIANRPLLNNSSAMIAMIRSELASDRRQLRGFYEMNFVLVPNNQAMVPIAFTAYPGESDPGPYPIPTNQPIELWPVNTGAQTLDEWQRDANNWGGDRHGLIAQPGTGNLYETWQMKKSAVGAWEASCGAKFDLNSNTMRPAGWTSGDAAGLAMFPALVRFDEVQRGEIEHAIRLVVKHTRREYIYPARHFASVPSTSDPNVPAMGQRLRLRSGFVVPTTWTPEAQCVARAMKKYGLIVADNGNFFQTSITPDDRWPSGCFDDLRGIDVNDFEVVQTTGETEGPRSPNPPTSNAGPDKSGAVGVQVSLVGSTTNGVPLWTKYSGPGTVTFENAGAASTTATFGSAGIYTLMLKVDDGVHTPGYDAVVVTISTGPTLISLALNPNPVFGGYATTGTVQLSSAAPAGGIEVALSDNLSILSTPTGITVPAGQSTGTFPASASVVSTSYTGNVVARVNGIQKVASITIQPGPLISNLTLSPSTVVGGKGSIGTVTLSKPAPLGGVQVMLSSTATFATVPQSVTLVAGGTNATFPVSTVPVVTTGTSTLSASIPGSARGANLGVLAPALNSLTVSPNVVTGGTATTGTVRLTGVTAVSVAVSLSVNGSVAIVPPKKTISAGASGASFGVTTLHVTQTANLTVIAKLGSVQRTATLTIQP